MSKSVCPYEPKKHTVAISKNGNEYCKEHRGFDTESNPNAPLYPSRIIELTRSFLIANKLEYKEKVLERKSERTITNEKLKELFEKFEDKYLKLDVLKEILGPSAPDERPLIKINWPQDKKNQTAVIPSAYMRRLSTYTRERWKQKRLKGEDGTELIRFWTDGEYDPEVEKEKREARKKRRQYEKERKALNLSHLQFQTDNKKGKWAEKE